MGMKIQVSGKTLLLSINLMSNLSGFGLYGSLMVSIHRTLSQVGERNILIHVTKYNYI